MTNRARVSTVRTGRTLSDSELIRINQWSAGSTRDEILGQMDRLNTRWLKAQEEGKLDECARLKAMIAALDVELNVRLHGESSRPPQPKKERPRPYVIMNGCYAHQVNADTLFAIKISVDFRLIKGEGGAIPGGQMVAYLTGRTDKLDWLNCAFLLGTTPTFWRAHAQSMNAEYIRRMLAHLAQGPEAQASSRTLFDTVFGNR